MEKRGLRWISLVLLAAWSHVTECDLYHHMEDAFADDSADKGTTCRSERTVICRLGNMQISTLRQLDPCLCTHLIFTNGRKDPAVPEWLRKSNPDLRFLVSTPLEIFLKKETSVHTLMENIHKRGFDGLDLTLSREAERTEYQGVLQEVTKQLASADSSGKLLHLTFVNYAPPASFISEILRQIDVASFTFFADFSKNGTENTMLREQISKLGIPQNKTLHGILLTNIKDIFDDVQESEVFQRQRCSEIPSESIVEEVLSPTGRDSQVQKLLDEVDYAKRNKDKNAGIDVWSLADDDAEGICGKGFFPVLHYISNAMYQDPQTFDEFADLDIVLSTGESQQLQYLQDVSATAEDMKKLPCDRVGFYRHPSDCSKFYHCSEYRTTKFNHTGPYAGFLYKCPNGLVYDERQGSCIWASWSDPCPGSGELLPVPAKKFSCTVPGFHVDPENCRWFYYCSDLGDGSLEAFEFLCPSDLLGYDEEKMLCNWKWTVPACVNHGTDPEVNVESITTPRVQISENKVRPQNITPKVLNAEDIQISFPPPSHSTRKPRKIKLHLRERLRPNVDRKDAVLVDTDGYTSLYNDLQQLVTTESSKGITDTDDFKLLYNSSSDGRLPNERQNLPQRKSTMSLHNDSRFVTTDTLWTITDDIEDVKMKNNFSPQERSTNERQDLQERKYGTAVWRRSWVNDRIQNHGAATPQISTSDVISKNDRINEKRLNDGENDHRANRNDLGINVDRGVSSFERDNEPERSFKGVVRKININGEIDQSFDSRQDQKDVEREISTPVRNAYEFSPSGANDKKIGHDEKTLYNMSNTENNRDFETVSVQNQPKNIQFLNVRCSKLQTGNDQPQEIGTLGCTSEVSLTIQVRRGKDPSKYTLKEDKITRTALQESQRVSYIENPRERKTNNLDPGAKQILQRDDFQNSSISQRSKQNRNESTLQEKISRSAVAFTLEPQSSKNPNEAEMHTTKLNGNSDAKSQGYILESSLTKSPVSYDIQTPNIYDKQLKDTSETATQRSWKLIDENSAKILNNADNDDISKKSSDNMKSLPIHFYPQGVLLNIDIARINEIPPQILLEVDNMLKTYMNEGNIDIHLLERKLNVSSESMEGKESQNMEPKEIMDMIKVIENIINTTTERNTMITELNILRNDSESSKINQTETYSVTAPAENEESEYGNISSTTKNISDKYFESNDTVYDRSNDKNGQNFQLMNDKIQNSEISPNNSNTDRNNSFGRRRLLRKFRYPSIREQLERQNKFRHTSDTLYQNPRSEAAFSTLTKSDTFPNTPKRDEKITDRTHSERNAGSLSAFIQTTSHQTDERPSQLLIQQHGDHRIVPKKGREEIYRPYSADQTLSSEAGHRPPPIQYETSEEQAWKNRRTSQEGMNVYPLPVSIPTTSGKNHEIQNSRPLVTDIKNTEFKSFHYDTYRYLTDSQDLSRKLSNDDASQTSTSQYDHLAHEWENGRVPQYDAYSYVSLRPIHVTASYGENIHNSRPLDKKDNGDFQERTFQGETHKHFHVEQTVPGMPKENNIRRIPTLQYGDRTKVSENRAIHDETYVHSTFKVTSSYFSGEDAELGSNTGRIPQNSARLEEKNGNFNLQTNIAETSNFQRDSHFAYNHEPDKSKVDVKFDVASNIQEYDMHNERSENLPRRREQDASFNYRQSGPSIRTNRNQEVTSSNVRGENFDTRVAQMRKKRKLRILVRKLTNSATVPRHESLPMNSEKNDLQQNISNNVLNALKSRILQTHAKDGTDNIELQIQFQDHVWNIPFVNGQSESALSPEVCTRPGLFQHPKDCNMFYECFWDKWLQRFTLHVFSCPVKLVYDESVGGCNRPSKDSSCKRFVR